MSSAELDIVASGDQKIITMERDEESMSPESSLSATHASPTSSQKASSRTPTSWDAEDDVLLMHLKDRQKLGWKAIASHFTNRTPNACQFRWRRLKSGNLKNPPKSAAALGDQFKQNPTMSSSALKKKTQPTARTKTETTDTEFAYEATPTGGFQGFDNSISSALAGLNALSNSPSYISSPAAATTPKLSAASPGAYVSGRANSITSLNHKYEGSPESENPLETSSRTGIVIPGTNGSGGYYADVSVDPTMNLPHNRTHPETPSSLTPRNSTSNASARNRDSTSLHPRDHNSGSISVAAAALRNNSIIQFTNDERASISSIARASISSLPSKSMNIPHHQSGATSLAHLPVLFGGAGSISGPSRNSSVSGAAGVHQTTVSSLRNGSLAGPSSGYYSRSGSVVIPHNTDKLDEPLKIDKEKIESSNKKLQKMKKSLPSSSHAKKKQKNTKLDLPWTMEEDELLINRRNRELSFAELSILLPQRTEGEIWARIDYLEKLRNGNDTSSSGRDRRGNRQSSIGLDDVHDLYDDDDDDVIGGIGIGVSDDDDDNPLIDDDDDNNLGEVRGTKRRASSAINPLVRRPIRR
ncbi:Dot6 protein [Candida orthopsilosis Co 90-125]|uniref:Dot6 protein n=1 Tax=Candida orthopsilosis (strain 90-125) TaxID=1136231 RepID=H8WW54_CANO9|nr:Dot6 protein [Candida orthopsilosis Co 90-125]CCG20678.1 Dot6 protein [Candida orthopsilosis Co 90-125]